MRSGAPSSFAESYVAACSATAGGTPASTHSSTSRCNGRSVDHQRIARIGSGDQRDSGLPGRQQILFAISSPLP